MAGSSLLKDKGYESIGVKGGKGSGGKSNDTIKLVLALCLFLVAGLVFAYFQGWLPIGSEPKPVGPTQEQVQALEQQKVETEKLIKSGKAVTTGSD